MLKGSRDAFVESLRTNTSIVRRHIKTPELRIREQIVGRQSVTTSWICSIWRGLANPDLVAEVARRLARIDIDAVLAARAIWRSISSPISAPPFLWSNIPSGPTASAAGWPRGGWASWRTAFLWGTWPRASGGASSGRPRIRAGELADGVGADRTALSVRAGTLLLPALYMAMVTFHQEMIPTRLALSMIAAKQDVPFRPCSRYSSCWWPLRFYRRRDCACPSPSGRPCPSLAALWWDSAAVEAKIVSPAVLIVVAIAGIAGYTMPSQEAAGALRIWRFLLAVLASAAGLFGVVGGAALLVCHLAGIESFGVPYLAPFAGGAGLGAAGRAVIRPPLSWVKLRART